MTNRLSPGCADALLFDLGRVVIDVDFKSVLDSWRAAAATFPDDISRRIARHDAHLAYERGEIDDAAFFASLREAHGLALTDAQLLAGWNAMFVGAMPGIEAQLARAAKHLPLYALSNTNTAHVAHFSERYADLLRPFKTLFLSSSIGLRKPDAAAYDHVVAQIGAPASRIVFFDDLKDNIAGAEARGLIGVHVTSKDDVANALTALGL